MKTILKTLAACAIGLLPAANLAAKADEATQVRAIIDKVNQHWQAENKPEVRAFWDNAAYHTGNMEAYFLTGNEDYRAYSESWAEHNQWKGAKSDNRAEWKLSYGETDDYVLFGDWQVCFQTYIDLYNIAPDDRKIRRAREVMEYEMSTPRHDYWWWSDGLYMVMPVMTKLYKVTHNKLYLDKLYEYITYADSIMFDADENLYYRDAKYVYPKHKSLNGKKDFWARGDGWVLAGLAKVLKDLPADYKHRDFFEKKFCAMAAAVAKIQQPEGYWTRSMMDPEHAPGPETSGTAFFTYGLLWGINNGYLDHAAYMPVVDKAWTYLTETALQKDGSVGYVQPIGEKGDLILRGELGAVFSDGKDGVPLTVLFRAGGDQSVRGYGYQSLGVRKGRAVVGGRYLAVASAEYQYYFVENWGIAFFIDAGNASDTLSHLDPAIGYGVGGRWRSPAGPIGVDLAYGERTGNFRLHFSLGFTF